MKRFLAVLGLALMTLGISGAVAFASDGNNGKVCVGNHITPPNGTKSITITAPQGQAIAGYCVKAGSANQGLGPEYIDFDPPVHSVVIEHSSGKDISHYVVNFVPLVYESPSPSPSVTPSESSSPSPSPSVHETESPSPSPSPSASESSSPSPSPSASESSSPSPSPSASESSSPSPSPSQQTASPSPSPSASESQSPNPNPSHTHTRSLPPTTSSTTSPPATTPEVTPSETPTASFKELAHTGLDIAVILWLAAAAMGVGVLAYVWSTRTREH